MILALSGAFIYFVFLVIVMVVLFPSLRKIMKGSAKQRELQSERLNEINSFILQYEAEKAKREREAAPDKVVAENAPAPTISMEKDETADIPAETVVRVTALHMDAGMTAEQIAEKTGLSPEVITKIISRTV